MLNNIVLTITFIMIVIAIIAIVIKKKLFRIWFSVFDN